MHPAGCMRPAKEFRAARETFRRDQQSWTFYYFRLLFVSVDEQFFSFFTGFVI